MHQAAFPGEDISDRPEPTSAVPAFLELIAGECPSGRYRAAELVTAGAWRARPGFAGPRATRPEARLPELHPLPFVLPAELEAPSPPEYRGIMRCRPHAGGDQARTAPSSTRTSPSSPVSSRRATWW